jgi:hypothetical protein
VVWKAEYRLAKFAVSEHLMITNSDSASGANVGSGANGVGDTSGRELQDATRSQTRAPENPAAYTFCIANQEITDHLF